MGRPMGRPMGIPMGRSMGIPMGRRRGRPMGRPMGSPMGRPMERPMGRSNTYVLPFDCGDMSHLSGFLPKSCEGVLLVVSVRVPIKRPRGQTAVRET